MIRALLGGTHAVRDAGVEYLPQQVRESYAAYTRRLQRSFLFPAFRRTVETFVGRVLGQPIDTSGVMQPLRDYLEDADRDGNNITVFARHLFFDAIAYGVSWVFVDRDQLAPGSRLSDVRRNNARPYLVHVQNNAVIGWRREWDGSVARVRIRETMQTADAADEWNDDASIEQIRVVEPRQFAVYRPVPESSKWAVAESGPHGSDVVPIVPLYTDKTGFFTARPPLLDLAWLNICHWQSSSDQRHIEHIIRVPILLGAGFKTDELSGVLELGADRMIIAGNTDAWIKYVEHSGAAAEVGRADLEDLESKMADLGAQVVNRAPAMETATKTAIDSAESGASLAAMTMALQDALNLAIYYMGRMLNIADAGEVVINADIPSATRAVEELRSDIANPSAIQRTVAAAG
jgi:hypothetical protein